MGSLFVTLCFLVLVIGCWGFSRDTEKQRVKKEAYEQQVQRRMMAVIGDYSDMSIPYGSVRPSLPQVPPPPPPPRGGSGMPSQPPRIDLVDGLLFVRPTPAAPDVTILTQEKPKPELKYDPHHNWRDRE